MEGEECHECGGVTVKIHDGSLVVKHADPECSAASDPELLCYQTTSMSDIMVKSDVREMMAEVDGNFDVDESTVEWSEYHITAHMPESLDDDAHFVEVRGKVTGGMFEVTKTEHLGITLAPGFKIWVYPVTQSGLPDQSSGVNITRLFGRVEYRHMMGIWLVGASMEPQVHRIHKPSSRVPTCS